MTTKRERLYAEVERMKSYYRQWPTEKLRELDQQKGTPAIAEYRAAIREVLKEREEEE